MNKTITGHKGGSKKPRQPVEMPDSVRSIARAKILLALGEGEFDGGVDGRSIYLDDTPLLAADGSVNFPGVTWEFRPLGGPGTHCRCARRGKRTGGRRRTQE